MLLLWLPIDIHILCYQNYHFRVLFKLFEIFYMFSCWLIEIFHGLVFKFKLFRSSLPIMVYFLSKIFKSRSPFSLKYLCFKKNIILFFFYKCQGDCSTLLTFFILSCNPDQLFVSFTMKFRATNSFCVLRYEQLNKLSALKKMNLLAYLYSLILCFLTKKWQW